MKIQLHFLVIIILLVISIASTNIPASQEFQPTHELAWHIGYDEDFEAYVFSIKYDASCKKAYLVGLVNKRDPLTATQTAFDDDIYLELYDDFWVFAETTTGVTAFHIWREGNIVKTTVNGFSQKDFTIGEKPKPANDSSDLVAATVRLRGVGTLLQNENETFLDKTKNYDRQNQ